MGFDLCGINAKSETGEYFRNNVWYWRPLAKFVLDNCNVSSPDDWHFNNGAEVNEKEATEIGNKLTELLKNGKIGKYNRENKKRIKNLPLEKCGFCNGKDSTGKNISTQIECNSCKGIGKIESTETWYTFDKKNIKDFAKFCLESGGFTIG